MVIYVTATNHEYIESELAGIRIVIRSGKEIKYNLLGGFDPTRINLRMLEKRLCLEGRAIMLYEAENLVEPEISVGNCMLLQELRFIGDKESNRVAITTPVKRIIE